ncbi:hypothetical protein BU24DRAFT_427900 [Aaosphaeria arxii CBS 175.79]|uniref:Uncharacterized protein n=1 Tax=Aaosphaeria arxii CBS 175.79 TaxID=1450172 RepID=A0A6A5XAQ3_9PLEO|nr:uncharacterized protein BU24DRAFT_427900 [Aaosphaeria arxii CBS 175.79]KAF2009867.1 hypothetical protein BU24DRAFT_427900 [Aaosphaeria arxii CBS 175.79]
MLLHVLLFLASNYGRRVQTMKLYRCRQPRHIIERATGAVSQLLEDATSSPRSDRGWSGWQDKKALDIIDSLRIHVTPRCIPLASDPCHPSLSA